MNQIGITSNMYCIHSIAVIANDIKDCLNWWNKIRYCKYNCSSTFDILSYFLCTFGKVAERFRVSAHCFGNLFKDATMRSSLTDHPFKKIYCGW